MGRAWGTLQRFIGIRISPETYALLEAHAAEHQTTVSAFARQALEQAATQEVCTWKVEGGWNKKYLGGRFIMGSGRVTLSSPQVFTVDMNTNPPTVTPSPL